MKETPIGKNDALDVRDSQGLYPIRVVAAQTGLGVHTLRAWERRYGLPRPTRTAGEHRLYRAEDVALLRRVQELIAHGTPPSRACAIVLAEAEEAREPKPDAAGSPAAVEGPRRSPQHQPASIPALGLRTQLRAACVALDEATADGALSEAFTLFGPERALEQVVLPALVDIGSAWAEGRVSVAAEHFATTVVRSRLLAAFEGASRNDRQPLALIGAGPGDQHEIAPLALALLLRRRGWRAIFLGPNTPLEALEDAIARTDPRLICLSAATRETASALMQTLYALHLVEEFSQITLGYGGAPFRDDPALRRMLDGVATYLGDDLSQAVSRAHLLLLGEQRQPI